MELYPAQHGIRLFSSNDPKRHRFTQRNQNYAFHAGRGLDTAVKDGGDGALTEKHFHAIALAVDPGQSHEISYYSQNQHVAISNRFCSRL